MRVLSDVIKDLHEAWGGELWVDDRLAYKNGMRLACPFPLRSLRKGAREIEGVEPENVED